jgi:hypothetical protein
MTSRHVSFGTTSPNVPIQTAAIDSSEQSPRTEFADRVETVGEHEARLQKLEKELKRDQIEHDFAIAIEKCKDIGLRFSREPGGNYRITGTPVGGSRRIMGLLYQLAVAAASVGQVKMISDILGIVRRSALSFDDPRYPVRRLIYEAAYERLDPKSPEAVALKEESDVWHLG